MLFTTQPAPLAAVAARRQPHRGRLPEEGPKRELVVTRDGGREALGGPGLADDPAGPALGDPELLTEGPDGPPAAVRG